MNDLTILNELHKGILMGMNAIEEINKKCDDPEFQEELTFQYNNYQKTLEKVDSEFSRIGEIPDDNSINTKMMEWAGIQFNTLTDSSTSKLSEILIQGYAMGIIKGIKILNSTNNMDNSTKALLGEFIKLQKNTIDKLERYL